MTSAGLGRRSEHATFHQVGDGISESVEHDPAVTVAECQDFGARSDVGLGENAER